MAQTMEQDLIQAIEVEVNEAIRLAERDAKITGSVRIGIDAAWNEEVGAVEAKITIKGGHGTKRTAFVKNGQLRFDTISESVPEE